VTNAITNLASKLVNALGKEEEVLQELHEDVKATMKRMCEQDPGLERLLEKAHGYVVFPSVGKATAVLGGAYGKGEVFERGNLIGYAAIVQLTLGVQVGGQTFGQIIAFESPQALERFKAGKTAFAANASAVLVKAGAAASAGYERGAAVFVSPDGGMMLEAAIGAQKFIYRPAALGRTKDAPPPGKSAATRKSPKTHKSAGRRKPLKHRRKAARG
jgi:lipid-binding SYLF domain-containing protein